MVKGGFEKKNLLLSSSTSIGDYTYKTGLQIVVKSKLLVLVSSNMSYNVSQDLYFIVQLIHEFTKDFFQTLVLD